MREAAGKEKRKGSWWLWWFAAETNGKRVLRGRRHRNLGGDADEKEGETESAGLSHRAGRRYG